MTLARGWVFEVGGRRFDVCTMVLYSSTRHGGKHCRPARHREPRPWPRTSINMSHLPVCSVNLSNTHQHLQQSPHLLLQSALLLYSKAGPSSLLSAILFHITIHSGIPHCLSHRLSSSTQNLNQSTCLPSHSSSPSPPCAWWLPTAELISSLAMQAATEQLLLSREESFH